MRGMMLIKVMI